MSLIKEAWSFRNSDRKYQMCTNCVMDTTDSLIEFDQDGVCNHCDFFKEKIEPVWFKNHEERKELLEQKVNEIKKYGKNKEYDCIIGLSGGVDSSYLAVKVAEYGLRPLVVHVDAGWNSELAVKNIEQIVSRLGFDLITHVIDWQEMKDLQLAFLRSNVANQDIPQDHAFFAALYNYAVSANIRYVISGYNYSTESIIPKEWGYNAMDARHLKSICNFFGAKKLRTFPLISFFNYYFYYPYVKKMQVVTPLNYMSYNKNEAIRFLEEEYGWKYYGGKHYESHWTRFFQSYYLPIKFGYDKRKAHLSSLILSNQMNRGEAIKELHNSFYDESTISNDILYVSKKLGISTDELENLISAPPRYYKEFPNNEALYLKLRFLMDILRNIRNLLQRALNFIK